MISYSTTGKRTGPKWGRKGQGGTKKKGWGNFFDPTRRKASTNSKLTHKKGSVFVKGQQRKTNPLEDAPDCGKGGWREGKGFKIYFPERRGSRKETGGRDKRRLLCDGRTNAMKEGGKRVWWQGEWCTYQSSMKEEGRWSGGKGCRETFQKKRSERREGFLNVHSPGAKAKLWEKKKRKLGGCRPRGKEKILRKKRGEKKECGPSRGLPKDQS